MLIGAHVRGGGALTDRLVRGVEVGADAIQVFTQSPRAWKPTQYAPEVLAAYRDAARAHPTVRRTYCHATYLINLAAVDDAQYAQGVQCLMNNLGVARGMGASGLVLHIGSHKGAGVESVAARVAAALKMALDRAPDPEDAEAPPCPILLENAAGSGGTVGRTLEELEIVIDAADGDERLGICIDTQHLWASGVDYSTIERADAVIEEVRSRFGLDRLGCMHLNDSKIELGGNRDRHENLGQGTIGADALGALIGHPELVDTAALLEVPGEGDGPRKVDVDTAKSILESGIANRSGGTSKRSVKQPAPAAVAPKKAAPKKAAPKKAAPKKAGPKKAAPKKLAVKKSAAKKGGK